MLRLKCENKERIIMDKKNYLIIVITILAFVIAIIAILLSGEKENWTTDIFEATNYQITMLDCNGREKILDNNILTTLSNQWDTLSNNGPWTGDTNACYTTLTISYDNNGIIRQKQIILIDDNSLVLDLQTSTIYYTNASEIINELNMLFKA